MPRRPANRVPEFEFAHQLVANSPLPQAQNATVGSRAKALQRQADGVASAVTLLGALGIIGSLVISLQRTNDDGSHPYLGLGVGLAITVLIQTLVIVTVLRAIELFAASKVGESSASPPPPAGTDEERHGRKVN